MEGIARMPLKGGGSVLIESSVPTADGPVKVGRLNDAIHDLPTNLQTVLGPITETARAVLSQLRKAGPDEVEVEFGVDLATEAGAVITKTAASCHLKVTMLWRNGEPGQDGS